MMNDNFKGKKSSRIKKLFLLWSMLFSIVAFVGCIKNDLCRWREISRIPSPDKIVDAVISVGDCGATTNYSYRVYVVKSNKGVIEDDLIFLADNVEDITTFWKTPKQLVISYKKARIFEFRNFWHSKAINDFRYVVSIVELKHDECQGQKK